MDISARICYKIIKITQNKEWDFIFQDNQFTNLNKKIGATLIEILFVVISLWVLCAFGRSLNGKSRRAKDKEWSFCLLLVLIVLFSVVGIITLLTL